MNKIARQIIASLLVTVIVILGLWGFIEIERTSQLEESQLSKDQKQTADHAEN